MNFACENCQRRYTLADEKIRDRAVKIRCKACQHLMSVGPLPAPEPEPEAEGAPNEDATRMVSLESLESLRAQTKAPAAPQNPWEDEATRAAPPAEASALWFVSSHGKQIGPFTVPALSEKIHSGEVQARNFVWKKGMGDWRRAVDVPELAGLFATGAPAAAVAPPPPPVAASDFPFGGDDRAAFGQPSDGAYLSGEAEEGVAANPGRSGRNQAAAPRDLDAQDLFSDLELSKVIRAPQPDLSDLEHQPAESQGFDGEPDAPAAGDFHEPLPQAPAPATGRQISNPNHTPHRGTVAMTAGPQRSGFRMFLALVLLLIAIVGALATLIHERIIDVPKEIQDPVDAYWPVPSRAAKPSAAPAPKPPAATPPANGTTPATGGTPTAPPAGAASEPARTGTPPSAEPAPTPPAQPRTPPEAR